MTSVGKPRLTRADLDKLSCQALGCTHESHDGLVLHGACHVKAPSTARYWASGVIELRCSKCDKWIADVALHPEVQAVANERLKCNDPNCKEPPEGHSMVFRSQCHPKIGVFATYMDEHLVFQCGKCEAIAGSYHVAAGEHA